MKGGQKPVVPFEVIKQKAKIVDVVLRYKVQLKFKGKWATALCPLPSHKTGEKNRTFTVNVEENYFRCFSESCCASNGGKKGGDVINFVALMERSSVKEAAQKIASWYGLSDEKRARDESPAPPRGRTKESPLKAQSNDTSLSDRGKGFLHRVNVWLDVLLVRRIDEDEAAYMKRVKHAVGEEIKRSYSNGLRVGQGLDSLPPAFEGDRDSRERA